MLKRGKTSDQAGNMDAVLGLAAGTDVWVDDHSGDGDDGWNEAGDDNGSGAHTGAYNAPSFDVVEGYCVDGGSGFPYSPGHWPRRGRGGTSVESAFAKTSSVRIPGASGSTRIRHPTTFTCKKNNNISVNNNNYNHNHDYNHNLHHDKGRSAAEFLPAFLPISNHNSGKHSRHRIVGANSPKSSLNSGRDTAPPNGALASTPSRFPSAALDVNMVSDMGGPCLSC